MSVQVIRLPRGGQAAQPSSDPPALRGALDLLEMGLAPVVLRAAGEAYVRGGETRTATGKEPRLEEFAVQALRAGETELRRAWAEHPGSGVGVLLGRLPVTGGGLGDYQGRPGVVDVEVDDPEAAGPVLERVWPGGVPPTLRFESSGPGRWHYLFAIDPDTANELVRAGISAAVLKGLYTDGHGKPAGDPAYAGLEIRFGKLSPPGTGSVSTVQTVVPPTPRADGSTRQWVGEAVLPFPRELLADLVENAAPVRAFRAWQAARELRAALRDEPVDRDELRGMSALEKFLYALDRVGHRYTKTGPKEYACRCTARDHPDAKPSMTFKEKEGGGLQVTCHSRDCGLAEIMGGVGLWASDAMPARFRRRVKPRDRRRSNLDALDAPTGPAAVTDEEAAAWAAEQERYAAAFDERPELEEELARRLGLPRKALGAITFGYRPRNPVKDDDGQWDDLGPAWTWAEYDHRVRAVSINRRFLDPELGKKLIGSRRDDPEHPDAVTHRAARGLVYGSDFAERPGPVYVVEGESDFLALDYLGHACVGRPGRGSGLREVALLLKDDPREVVVMGERDRKPSGDWPGDPQPVARELAGLLGRPVKTVLPPEPHKDARAWLVAELERAKASGPAAAGEG
jgi:hypothetical protein